jgi:hypothetical protein
MEPHSQNLGCRREQHKACCIVVADSHPKFRYANAGHAATKDRLSARQIPVQYKRSQSFLHRNGALPNIHLQKCHLKVGLVFLALALTIVLKAHSG